MDRQDKFSIFINFVYINKDKKKQRIPVKDRQIDYSILTQEGNLL